MYSAPKPKVPDAAITGFLNQTFTGSGNYSQNTSSGYVYGSGYILDYIKEFTGLWNLFTGLTFNQTEYRANNFYNTGKNKYLNNNPIWYIDSSAFINVSYDNPWDTIKDVALLTVSGYQSNSGISLLITGGT